MIDNDPPYLIISKHYFLKLIAAYNQRWPAQQPIRKTKKIVKELV